MRCALLILFSSVVGAAAIVTGPISVSGGGFYEGGLPIFGFDLRVGFSGTNGTDNVSLLGETAFDYGSLGDTVPSVITGHTGGPSPIFDGTVTIDNIEAGIRSNSPFNAARFTVGNGGGSIEITDQNGNLLAEAPLIGYVDVTSEKDTYGIRPFDGTYGFLYTDETFNIVPTPEPASAVFVGVIAIVVGLAKRSRILPRRRP